jgi:hypothetical protein
MGLPSDVKPMGKKGEKNNISFTDPSSSLTQNAAASEKRDLDR